MRLVDLRARRPQPDTEVLADREPVEDPAALGDVGDPAPRAAVGETPARSVAGVAHRSPT